MDPFHEQLARVALDAAGSFGFALAGGYAVQAHGFLAGNHDPGLDRSRFADALAAIDRLPDRLFQPYGMGPEDTSALRERMRAWARRISG